MNILILGGGGREHALAWAVLQNPKCDRLIVAPGNAGIAQIAECAEIDILDGGLVATFAEENAIDFVIVGPEAPLAAGVSDRLRETGASRLRTEPRGGAARGLEGLHQGDLRRGRRADGGLGAVLRRRRREGACPGEGRADRREGRRARRRQGRRRGGDAAEAEAAIDDMFGGAFGAAGAEVVIEEFMEGEEASFFVLCDGADVLAIGTAQDHKRVGEGDTGPNTGGMGAYSPAPVLTEEVAAARWRRSCVRRWPRWPGAARPTRACSTRG
jgi:phosphoribosylamine---glycine ligase